MKLKDYIELKRGNAVALAAKIGTSKSQVSQWAAARGPVDPKYAVQIEMATGGQVARRDLRPNDWHLIWPELQAAA